jgi:hypothetical protein
VSRRMRSCAGAVFLALGVLICAVSAEAGGYNRFKLYVTTVLPPEAKNVGEAAYYLAFPTGYTLVTKSPAPKESEAIAKRAISPLFPRDRMMTIEDAILELIGSDARLVVDHEHKLFSFEWHKEGPSEKTDAGNFKPGADRGAKRLHGEADRPKQAKP